MWCAIAFTCIKAWTKARILSQLFHLVHTPCCTRTFDYKGHSIILLIYFLCVEHSSMLLLLKSLLLFDTAAVTCWQFFRQFVCGCSMQILSNDFTFFFLCCVRNSPAIDANGVWLESSWVTAWDFFSKWISSSFAPAQLERHHIFWCSFQRNTLKCA